MQVSIPRRRSALCAGRGEELRYMMRIRPGNVAMRK
jgi:hypothetical protein